MSAAGIIGICIRKSTFFCNKTETFTDIVFYRLELEMDTNYKDEIGIILCIGRVKLYLSDLNVVGVGMHLNAANMAAFIRIVFFFILFMTMKKCSTKCSLILLNRNTQVCRHIASFVWKFHVHVFCKGGV